jgi:hypothetical protein
VSEEGNRVRILHASKVFMTPIALKAHGQERRCTDAKDANREPQWTVLRGSFT